MIHDHVAQNIPSCRELVTSACFKQEWMWVKLRLVSSPEECLWGGTVWAQQPQISLSLQHGQKQPGQRQGAGKAAPAAPLEPWWCDSPCRAVTVRWQHSGPDSSGVLRACPACPGAESSAAEAAACRGFPTHPALSHASQGVWMKESTADRGWVTAASHVGSGLLREKENNSFVSVCVPLSYTRLENHPQGLLLMPAATGYILFLSSPSSAQTCFAPVSHFSGLLQCPCYYFSAEPWNTSCKCMQAHFHTIRAVSNFFPSPSATCLLWGTHWITRDWQYSHLLDASDNFY